MPDSKITNLSPSPYLLDRDLMVVVTGYLNEGSYPQTCQVPVSYIRRYITRLNLLLNPVSGIANYYNSGLNILSIWGTGIHGVPGNNVEIQFSQNTPAGQKYGKTGPICHSGIISTTGLNAYSGHPWGNLIRVDTHSQWPYSGVISQTGLNIIRGNLIDIQFDPASPAATIMHSKDGSWNNNFNKNSNLGNPYHSGIVSVTGLNATKGNLIDINYSSDWPHSGTIHTTGLNAVPGYGIYQKIESSFPYKHEVGTLEKVYPPSSNQSDILVAANSVTVLPDSMFPIALPNDRLYQSNTYTFVKYEAMLKHLDLTSSLNISYPPSSVRGTNGEPIGWNSYSISNVVEGYIKPRIGTINGLPIFSNSGFTDDDPYSFTDNIYYTPHAVSGISTFIRYNNIRFVGFLPINNNTNISGCVGFVTNSSTFYRTPSATINWNGTYTTSEGQSVPAYYSMSIGGSLTVQIRGRRFVDIKYV
jgi:hypothetical protein